MAAAVNHARLTDINRVRGVGVHAADRSWFERSTNVPLSDLLAEEVERLRPLLCDVAARKASEPVLLKIHDQRFTPSGVDLVPEAVTRAIFYLVRDPRDVAVSWAHHYGLSVDRSIARMGDAEPSKADEARGMGLQFPQWMGSWSDHCRSWIGRDKPNTLMLRYEDRLADPFGSLRAALAHARIDASDDVVAAAVTDTKFERLQEMESETGFRERFRYSTQPFFRSARAGGWREVLTKQQVARIENDHGAMMVQLGYL